MSKSECAYEDYYVNHAPHKDECKARRRRVRLFKTITGLRCVSLEKWRIRKVYKRLCELVRAGMECGWHFDHYNMWELNGVPFLLVEPYDLGRSVLIGKGYVGIKIPTDLSLYCGSWKPNPQDDPQTNSYLYTYVKYLDELVDLQLALQEAAKNAPRWNYIDSGDGND